MLFEEFGPEKLGIEQHSQLKESRGGSLITNAANTIDEDVLLEEVMNIAKGVSGTTV